jgi:hypothetical protein
VLDILQRHEAARTARGVARGVESRIARGSRRRLIRSARLPKTGVSSSISFFSVGRDHIRSRNARSFGNVLRDGAKPAWRVLTMAVATLMSAIVSEFPTKWSRSPSSFSRYAKSGAASSSKVFFAIASVSSLGAFPPEKSGCSTSAKNTFGPSTETTPLSMNSSNQRARA